MTSTGKRVTPIDVEVGHRIRVARKAAKMSQGSLADALGVTFQQVQKYENGKNRVGAGRLFAIAKALNVEVVDFFEDNEGSRKSKPASPSAAQRLAQPYALRLVQAFSALPNVGAQRAVVLMLEGFAGIEIDQEEAPKQGRRGQKTRASGDRVSRPRPRPDTRSRESGRRG